MTTTARELSGGDDRFERAPIHPSSQLIQGQVVRDEPTPGHQVISTRVLDAFDRWTTAVPGRGEALALFPARLDELNVYTPDVSYIRQDRVPLDGFQEVDGPPDLAVEVRSLSTWRYNIGPKMRAYERSGLLELWLVDAPVAAVLVFRRSDLSMADFDVAVELIRGDSLRSPLLPGFALALDSVFAPPGPRF
jgi:Uma2 family endonuclease